MDKFTLHRLIKCLPILSFQFVLRCIQRSCDPGKDLSRSLRSATSLFQSVLKGADLCTIAQANSSNLTLKSTTESAPQYADTNILLPRSKQVTKTKTALEALKHTHTSHRMQSHRGFRRASDHLALISTAVYAIVPPQSAPANLSKGCPCCRHLGIKTKGRQFDGSRL